MPGGIAARVPYPPAGWIWLHPAHNPPVSLPGHQALGRPWARPQSPSDQVGGILPDCRRQSQGVFNLPGGNTRSPDRLNLPVDGAVFSTAWVHFPIYPRRFWPYSEKYTRNFAREGEPHP
jgi:hypothetical protein